MGGGGFVIDTKEQIKYEMGGLIKAPMLQSHIFKYLRKRLKETMRNTTENDDQTSHLREFF